MRRMLGILLALYAAALLVAGAAAQTYPGRPLQMSPEEFGRFVAAETAKWARVVREAGIRAE